VEKGVSGDELEGGGRWEVGGGWGRWRGESVSVESCDWESMLRVY
jgi:hypothetical protein